MCPVAFMGQDHYATARCLSTAILPAESDQSLDTPGNWLLLAWRRHLDVRAGMRVMNGRLHNLIRSPLIRNKYLNSGRVTDDEDDYDEEEEDAEEQGASHYHAGDGDAKSGQSAEDRAPNNAAVSSDQKHRHRKHHHHHHNNSNNINNKVKLKTKKKMKAAGPKGRHAGAKWMSPRRRSSEDSPLPKSIQFDESSDAYRCLCGCFHVKTGATCIAGIEIFLIFCYFINALTVLLQQKQAYSNGRSVGGAPVTPTPEPTSADYVPAAFAVASTALALALGAVLLMLVGLTRNIASLLIPHLLAQAIAILCLTGLLLAGGVALVTDHAYFYRLLNAAPFNDFPGQATVALDAETAVRVHAVLAAYALTLALELWFIVTVYNCYGYFTERRKYMNYCLAYSTPLKTLNSARYN